MLLTFPKGIHPDGHKHLTEDEKIAVMPVPAKVFISVSQHSGKPAEPVVKAGDEVAAGQLIAKAGTSGANVFASCSGKVTAIEDRPCTTGKCAHIVIENDKKNKTVTLEKLNNPTPEQIIERVVYSGIVGMGGAGFPAGSKLKQNKKIEVFIINAAECEPYINCDNRLMIEYPGEVLDGAKLLQTASGAARCVIAVEDNKPRAIAALNEYNAKNNTGVEVAILKTKYPQGDARRLIFAVTGKKVPQSSRSTDYGVMMNNLHTAYAVYQAVREGIPSYSRVMTVTGGGIKSPSNLLVANGILYQDIIDYCGGLTGDNIAKIISGGPMTGKAVLGTEYASDKISGCLLLLTTGEANTENPSACINCAKCARVCPVNLMPMYIDLYHRAENLEAAEKYGAASCIECGCCSYVCPAKRPLVASISHAKNKLKERMKK